MVLDKMHDASMKFLYQTYKITIDIFNHFAFNINILQSKFVFPTKLKTY